MFGKSSNLANCVGKFVNAGFRFWVIATLVGGHPSLQASPIQPSIAVPTQPPNLGGLGNVPTVDADPVPPNPGTSPSLTVSGSIKDGVKLKWGTPSFNVTGYILEKRTGAGGWNGITRVGPSVNEYTDSTGLIANQRYRYRVVPLVSQNGQERRAASLNAAPWSQGDLGSLQVHSRSGSADLFGFDSFLPEQSENLYLTRNTKYSGSYTKSTVSLSGSPGNSKEGYNDNFTLVENVVDNSTSATILGSTHSFWHSYSQDSPMQGYDTTLTIVNGIGNGTKKSFYSDGSSASRPIGPIDFNYYPFTVSSPYSEKVTETSRTLTHTNTGDSVWPPSGEPLQSTSYQLNQNSTAILANPISSENALPKAKAKLEAWKSDDWFYPNTNSYYGAQLVLGKPLAGKITATISEFQYRLAYSAPVGSESVGKWFIQKAKYKIDDPKTKDIDESKEKPVFSYTSEGLPNGTYDQQTEKYYSSPKDCPDSAAVAGYVYGIGRYYVDLNISDYRGLADGDEKRGGSSTVYDAYKIDAPEYYKPETAGPSIKVDLDGTGATSAYITAGFGGSVVNQDWTGTLTWSSNGIKVVRNVKGTNVVQNGSIQLGKQADGSFMSSVSLEVTSLTPDTPPTNPLTSNFTFRVKDDQGNGAGEDTARLHVVSSGDHSVEQNQDVDDYYTIPLSDATGPTYRKISLVGRPISDQPPQAKEESDTAQEETYVDAFTLGLRHNTTDIYTPIPGSDLTFSIRRNLQPEVWNYQNGLRPHERPDRPFGSGWSSNLASNIEFIISNGADSNGFVAPAEAVVTDDDGNSYRFFKYGTYWFPLPNAPHEAKAYLTTLQNINGNFVFKHKYGKKLEFAITPIVLTASQDRLKGSSSSVSHTYARLIKVSDRLLYSLQYYYGGTNTLIPDKIQAFRPDGAQIPNQTIYIRQDDNTRLVSAVWDTSGNQISYNYTTSQFAHPRIPNLPQTLHQLTNVYVPATNPISYTYELGSQGLPFVVENDPIPRTNVLDKVDTYQVNIASISQPSPSGLVKYGFTLATDESRQIYVKLPSFEGYVVQAGAPRFVRKVTLPDGNSSNFNNIGSIRLSSKNSGGGVQLTKSTTVTDAENHETRYTFGGTTVLSLQSFSSLFAGTDKARLPKLLYYTDMTVAAPGYGSETYSFNINAGLSVSKITDFSGNTTVYSYTDTFGSPTSLFRTILPEGFFNFNEPNSVTRIGLPSKTFAYDSVFRIMKEVKDENGNFTRNKIDTNGRRENEEKLTSNQSVVQRTSFLYHPDWPGFVSKQTVEKLSTDDVEAQSKNIVTNFTPDSNGRIATTTTYPDNAISLTTNSFYDLNNSTVYTISPAGTTAQPTTIRTRFDYDARHRLKKTTFDDDSTKIFDYDGRGRKTVEHDENGHITELVYDTSDRLIRKTRFVTGGNIQEGFGYNRVGSLITTVDPRGYVTTRFYDDIQRLTKILEPGKGTSRFVYEKNSGPSILTPSAFQPTTTIDGRGYTTTNVFNQYYRLTRTEKQYDGKNFASTRFGYDNVGNKKEETDALGSTTFTEYDSLNRPTLITYPIGKEQFFYTSTGLQWKKIDRRDKVSLIEYDWAGRPIKTTFPTVTAGIPIRQNEYDRAGNVNNLIDERGKTTTTVYDKRNRPVTITQPSVFDEISGTSKQSVTTKAYDFVGNVVDQWDARNTRTHFVYDEANRPTDVTGAYGTAKAATTHTDYDTNSNAVVVKDARLKITNNTYDSANRLETTTNAEQIKTQFKYDNSGNRTYVIDGKKQTTRFAYDGLNRVTKITDPVGGVVQFIYDALTKRERIDTLKRRTSYIYDAMHRLSTVTYTGDVNGFTSYGYDTAGNLLSVNQPDDAQDVAYTYDALNRVETEKSNSVTYTYGYDLAGNRTSAANNSTSRTLIYAYDDINRVKSITEGSRITEYGYNLNGGEARRTLKATGSTATNEIRSTFDLFNRLDLRLGFKGSTQIYSYDPEYDANGNLTSVAETYSDGIPNRSLSMDYDFANRLTVERSTTAGVLTTTTHRYDAADNRFQKIVATGGTSITTVYAYNSLNQLTDVTAPATTPVSFAYDAEGNRKSRTQGTSKTSYIYDFENRLASVRLGGETKAINIQPLLGNTAGPGTQAYYILGGGVLHEYKYDYRSRRVKRVEDGVSTRIVFSGGTSVMEVTGTATINAPTVEYVRGPDMGGGVGGLLYTDRGGTLSFDHYNSRGDVIAKSNAAGDVTYRAAYEAFGTRKQESGTTADRQKANTKDEDPTGLLNEGFRYRDLETGVFITRDPMGSVDGPNLYAYVRQNPWTSFDPHGLWEENPQYKKWSSIAADENRNGAARLGATFMAAGEAFNPFRSDSNLRQAGREFAKNAETARETLRGAPPGMRELAQITMGLGMAGTSPLTLPSGVGELGDSVRQVGVIQTAKNIATGLGDHAVNNPLEFATEAGIGLLTGKMLAGSGVSTKGISTPHGLALQADTLAAKTALSEVQSGATIYRQGSFGVQNTADAQFWSLQNPAATPGFANRMGMPTSAPTFDWIMGGTVKSHSPVITRPAPGIGGNIGGDMEAVVPPNGVGNLWFHMPD